MTASLMLNFLLAAITLCSLAMFKKLLLATLIVIIGLWGAGYNVTGIKDRILNVADDQAGMLSGRSQLDDDNWGDEA